MILEALGSTGRTVDWDRVSDYLDLFGMAKRIDELRRWSHEAV